MRSITTKLTALNVNDPRKASFQGLSVNFLNLDAALVRTNEFIDSTVDVTEFLHRNR